MLPGTVGLGMYASLDMKCTCDKKVGDDVKPSEETLKTELGAEGTLNLQNHELKARGGFKMLCGKDYTFQMMADQDFKLSSAFSFAPHKNFKFIWSDQFDAKKLCTKPQEGIDYKYGFTVEMNMTPDI